MTVEVLADAQTTTDPHHLVERVDPRRHLFEDVRVGTLARHALAKDLKCTANCQLVGPRNNSTPSGRSKPSLSGPLFSTSRRATAEIARADR